MGNLLRLENTLMGKIGQEGWVPKILICKKKINTEKANSSVRGQHAFGHGGKHEDQDGGKSLSNIKNHFSLPLKTVSGEFLVVGVEDHLRWK